MKNRGVDLHNHLFEQLERLNDEDLTGEALEQELKRAQAMVGVSKAIVENQKLHVEVAKLQAEYQLDGKELPISLEYKK